MPGRSGSTSRRDIQGRHSADSAGAVGGGLRVQRRAVAAGHVVGASAARKTAVHRGSMSLSCGSRGRVRCRRRGGRRSGRSVRRWHRCRGRSQRPTCHPSQAHEPAPAPGSPRFIEGMPERIAFNLEHSSPNPRDDPRFDVIDGDRSAVPGRWDGPPSGGRLPVDREALRLRGVTTSASRYDYSASSGSSCTGCTSTTRRRRSAASESRCSKSPRGNGRTPLSADWSQARHCARVCAVVTWSHFALAAARSLLRRGGDVLVGEVHLLLGRQPEVPEQL